MYKDRQGIATAGGIRPFTASLLACTGPLRVLRYAQLHARGGFAWVFLRDKKPKPRRFGLAHAVLSGTRPCPPPGCPAEPHAKAPKPNERELSLCDRS